MQMSRNVVFHNFIPSSPLSTNVKLKGRPAPRLCQIKPISCCLKKKIKKIAGKQKTAEIHISHWASTSFSLSPLPFIYFLFSLYILPTEVMLKLILDRYPLKILCVP